MQKHLYEHFDLHGHTNFWEDFTVALIDKTDPRDPTKRDDYWVYARNSKATIGYIHLILKRHVKMVS